LFMAFAGCASTLQSTSSASAESAIEPSSFNGAWEIQTSKGIYVICFIDRTFTIYTRDGGYVLDGIYSLGKDSWNIRSNTRNPQHTRNLFLQFDIIGLDSLGFTYEISSNELKLSSDSFTYSDVMPLVISNTPAHSLLSGTYRRSSFAVPSAAGNPLIGDWKAEFSDAVQIYRFFPDGHGSVYTFETNDNYVGPFRYEPGANRFTYINTGQTYSFAINSNVLRVEWSSTEYSEYRKALFWSGVAYARNSDYDRAITDFTQYIINSPNDALAYLNRAIMYSAKGDYNRAIADYTEVIRLNPNYADAYNGRAWTYAYDMNTNYNQALADINQALRLSPNNSSYLDTRGWVYLRMGDYDRAIADFETVIRMNAGTSSAASSIEGLELARRRGR